MGRDDPAPEHFEIYSEDCADEPPVPDGSSGGRSLELWRCWHCAGDTFMANQSGWICSTCGADEFYNARHHQWHETRHGVWMYMPNQPSEDLTPPDVPGPPAIGRPTTSNRGPPSSFGAEAGETAESERPTEDPSIDPDTMQPTPRRQRPRRRARARGEPGAPDGDVGDRPPSLPEDALPHDDSGQSHQDAIQQLVTALSSLNKHKDKKGNQSGTASWDSRQGPAPGVRYRSGMPPQPPKWSYRPDDLRSFARWQRKVEVWTMQVYNYLSKREAALLLYTSLTGEAEELLETATLERINHADGIDYIVSFLKSNLDTKLVYQKRKLLGDFESIVRQPSESIRGYLNRYERTESQLSAVNIFPDKMYDSEAKGYRLLERARLSPDAQRLVLIGAGYQINSKAISESMLMSFPEHKPPPVLHGRDGQPIQRYNHGGKGGKPQQTTTFPNGAAPSKSYGKGGKKGKFSPHRHTAYITEADDQDQIDDQPNDEPDFDPERTSPSTSPITTIRPTSLRMCWRRADLRRP